MTYNKIQGNGSELNKENNELNLNKHDQFDNLKSHKYTSNPTLINVKDNNKINNENNTLRRVKSESRDIKMNNN